jgi:hypothetical protein
MKSESGPRAYLFSNLELLKKQAQESPGVGVISDEIPFETSVIPAKAGIQSEDSAFPQVCGVDSRFRGNDCAANDTAAKRIPSSGSKAG